MDVVAADVDVLAIIGIVFRSSLLLDKAIKKVEAEVEDLPEVHNFIKFIKESERGVCR